MRCPVYEAQMKLSCGRKFTKANGPHRVVSTINLSFLRFRGMSLIHIIVETSLKNHTTIMHRIHLSLLIGQTMVLYMLHYH